jgi:hypothetical protein
VTTKERAEECVLAVQPMKCGKVLCVYHAVQCAETIQERIEAHYTLPKSKRKIKTSFQIMDKTRNKTGTLCIKLRNTFFHQPT